ncbi:hypothetical protein ELUMI_v1c02460 [Williamsoniiplasma luminosum]|uniref:Transmembrane protein n=1 Tax=Williamsoniiplasma luminosum TaxID=214888 RepID=A0A2K8NW62_9MOLU|nr:hypothetical protein [Williamsoniiplasma luminosum]ATZ16971.1 hypothetical protein ELUMI_v1c02460 [Williamsoniiplasma luminosum]
MQKRNHNFGSKFKLNWKIKDPNENVIKKNAFLYKISALVLFLFTILYSLTFLFIFIVANDKHLHVYFEYLNSLTKEGFIMPSFNDVWGTLISSLVFFGISLVLIFLYKPIVTSNSITLTKQSIYIKATATFLMVSFLLTSLSQYHYANYAAFIKLELATEANENFTAALKSVGPHLSFSWKTPSIVWWVLFVQIIILFSIILFLENAISRKENIVGIEKYIEYNLKTSKSFAGSKIIEKMNKFFKPTTRNISIWALVIVGLILLPNFIYTILISNSSTKMGALIQWSYNLPNLLKDFKGIDLLYANLLGDKYSLAYFALNSLPIIIIGITFSTTFFFLSIIVRSEKQISDNVFILQNVVLAFETLFLLILMLVIKFEVNNLANIWKTEGAKFEEGLRGLMQAKDFQEITTMFHWDAIQDVIRTNKIEWFSQNGIIAETIISFAFAGSTFTGIGIGLVKNIKIHRAFFKLQKEIEGDEEYAY